MLSKAEFSFIPLLLVLKGGKTASAEFITGFGLPVEAVGPLTKLKSAEYNLYLASYLAEICSIT